MPLPGKRWRHVTFGTKRSWNPGEQRGFRSRQHRIHSSGDYKHPPPEDEHAGLRRYWQQRLEDAVTIPDALRAVMGQRLIGYLAREGHRVLAAAVAAQHGHLLVELPDDVALMKSIVGKAKSAASRAVRKQMPGRVWADGADFQPVDDDRHHHRALHYIKFKQEPGAWTWWFREGICDEWLVF